MASSTLLRTLVAPQPRSAVAKPVPVPLSFLHGNQRKVALSLSVAQRRPSRRGSIVCQAQEAAAVEVPDVTSSTWQEQVLGSDMAVLVEFWAPWCGPCRMMHPIIGKLSKIYEGKLKCFKLNTDENQEVAAQYGIRSIPTILIFKNGEKKDATIGAVSESALVTTIEKYIGN